jgi:5'-nucleotidase
MTTILITNDDGINNPGLHALAQALAPLGRVVTVAPDRDNSAISHALTMNRPLRLIELGPDRYSLDGTPSDCVTIGLNKVLSRPPDLLVSGINNGTNIGDDINYSGTVSAAIEGAMYAVASVAVSLAGEPPYNFAVAGHIIRLLAERIIGTGLPANTLMNVNVPAGSDIAGLRVTRQGRRLWQESVQEITDPHGRPYFWIGGGHAQLDPGRDTDGYALRHGYVSITPIHLDLTNHEGISYFKEELGLEAIRITPSLS